MIDRPKKKPAKSLRRKKSKRIPPMVIRSAIALLAVGSVIWVVEGYWPDIMAATKMADDAIPGGLQIAPPARLSGDYASPEAVFEAAKRAGMARDYKAELECSTPLMQLGLLQGQVLVAKMRAKSPTQRSELDALINKYGGAAGLESVRDKGSLFRDARLFCDSIRGPIAGEDQMRAGAAALRLQNVHIDGDNAVGTVFYNGTEHSQRKFARVAGEWKIASR